jgi:hypothetical protein
MVIVTDRVRRAGWIGCALAAAAVFGPEPAAAEPAAYVARAQIVGVDRVFLQQSAGGVPGAGVRAFRDPEAEGGGRERFDVRWYAVPPGIPPGAVLLLETVQERSPVVKNHVRRTAGKSEGHVRTTIEIPAAEIRRAGRVAKWRLRVIWRGNALATAASPNWDG